MDLRELLELMIQLAKLTHTKPCLGIRVCADGTGRSTPGALPAELSVDCKYGPRKLEWDTPEDGAKQLEHTLLLKFQCERKAAAEAKGGRG